MKFFHHNFSKALSLVELLVTFVLLGLLIALLVPQYLNLQRNTNVQIAQQQCETVHKAVLSWMASFPDIQSAAGLATGPGVWPPGYGNTDNTGLIHPAAFIPTATGVVSYLDPTFFASTSSTAITYAGADVYCFHTLVMEQITGSAPTTTPASVTFSGSSYTIPAAPVLKAPKVNGKYVAYGVVFWPADTTNDNSGTSHPGIRRTTQPIVALFLPN